MICGALLASLGTPDDPENLLGSGFKKWSAIQAIKRRPSIVNRSVRVRGAVPAGGGPGLEPAADGGRDLGQPVVHRTAGTEPAAVRAILADPAGTTPGHSQVQRRNPGLGHLQGSAYPALVSEADFIATQDVAVPRGPEHEKKPAPSPAPAQSAGRMRSHHTEASTAKAATVMRMPLRASSSQIRWLCGW